MLRKTIALCVGGLVIMLFGCGGGVSSPTTPAQIPNEISFAENYTFDTGIALPLGKTVMATSNVDYTGGTVIFTNSMTGAVVIDGSCGTATVDGVTINILGPSNWPNQQSQCDISFEYEGTVVPITINDIAESISKGIWKATIGASSVRATYSHSAPVPQKSWNTVRTLQVLENARRPSIAGADGNLYICFVGLAGSPLINSYYGFSVSSDNGVTFSEPVDISNGGSYENSDGTIYHLTSRCDIYAKKIGSNIHIAAIMYGTENGCGSECTQQSLARFSTDGGITFSDPMELANMYYGAGQNPTTVTAAFDSTGDGIFIGYKQSLNYCSADSGCGTIYEYLAYQPNDRPLIASKGNYVFVVYDDGGANQNLSMKVFVYSGGTFTERASVQLSNSSAATGNANVDGITTLARNSNPVIGWHYGGSLDGYVDIYNVTTNQTTSELISSDLVYQAAPSVDAANTIHLLYYTTDVYYRLYEYDLVAKTFSMGDEMEAGYVKDIIDSGATGSVFNGIDGKFHYIYDEEDLLTDDPYSVYNYGYLSMVNGVLE